MLTRISFLKALKYAFLFTLIITSTSEACPDIDGLADLNCDGKLEILAFGDSITKGEQDELRLGYIGRLKLDFFPNARVFNLGHGGETTSAGKKRASRYFRNYDADYAIILEGVNDYFSKGHSASATKNNLSSIVRVGNNTGYLTLLAKLTPVNRSRSRSQGTWVNNVNSKISSISSINFFSLGKSILSRDNLHPNGNGYERMASLAASVIQQKSDLNRPADHDHDGIYDFAEQIKYHTNPNLNDSDGDGISDGDEIFTYHSNPNNIDSDGDGISDSVEVINQTDLSSPLPKAPTVVSIQAL